MRVMRDIKIISDRSKGGKATSKLRKAGLCFIKALLFLIPISLQNLPNSKYR